MASGGAHSSEARGGVRSGGGVTTAVARCPAGGVSFYVTTVRPS